MRRVIVSTKVRSKSSGKCMIKKQFAVVVELLLHISGLTLECGTCGLDFSLNSVLHQLINDCISTT